MNDIVLLNLRISMWGVSRVVSDNEFEVDADKAMVRATKKILECPEYEFLLQLKRSIHRRLRTLALPGEILWAGVYPVSVAMVEAVEKVLEDFAVRWEVGVMGLEQVWDLRVKEVEERLRGLYDEADYPSWERVRGAFQVRWSYFAMSTPQVLQNISANLFRREQAKATMQWKEMLDEIRMGLRLTFKELVDALLRRRHLFKKTVRVHVRVRFPGHGCPSHDCGKKAAMNRRTPNASAAVLEIALRPRKPPAAAASCSTPR